MEIKHSQEKTRFDLYGDDGGHMGELEYVRRGTGRILATHTEVFAGHEGKGYAGMLLDALVEYAREKNEKIVPVCPYVKAVFKKYPEKYADVIA